MNVRFVLGDLASAQIRISLSPAPRPSGLPAFHRPGWKAARRRPVPVPCTPANGDEIPPPARLPSVMVPVLSSSSVFTSPAASTALPLMASTLCCITRSMPAMPMAESRPPMVVGIRQTSSETSTATVGTAPDPADAHCIHGERLQRSDRQQEDQRQAGDQDIQRDLVRRLLPLRAFHQRDHAVEERFAGIRRDADLDLVGENSRAAGDGAAVAARFADHRRAFAGDDGFVDGGDAFDHFAVARNQVAGFDRSRHRRRAASMPAPLRFVPLPMTVFAIASVLVLRRLSACALPRASAMASAKLANRTVNQSQSEI